MAPSSNKGMGYKQQKKKWRDEKDWKEYGHLPRPSTNKKYVGKSQVWKMLTLVTSLRMNDGGYTARLSRFQNMGEVQLLEEAMALGFVLIKSKQS